MATSRRRRAGRGLGFVLLGLTLTIAACNRGSTPATGLERAAVKRSLVNSAPVCSPLGAHAAHQGGFFSCDICHPCGGALGITSKTLTDGFQVSGTVVKNVDGAVNCTVTCHGSQSVSWTAGSLGCSNCHGSWQNGSGAVVSSHSIDPTQGLTANQGACTSCHSTANHFDPNMAIVNADSGATTLTSAATPAQITLFCTSCHDGIGKTITGKTPPLLLGYSSTTSGDFHGARAGTGFGSTLLTPFSVGQGALDCVSCHEPHASTNAFLFAPTVNGVAIPGGAITRSGMGAEALCAACHDFTQDVHAGCKISGCHDGNTVITPALDGVTPRLISPALATAAGKPCFFCHGHEGIVNFNMPTWNNHPSARGDYCGHCHSHWYPPTVVSTPPVIRNLAVTNVTTSSVKIVWDTDFPTTTYVERGLAESTDLTIVEGNPTLVTHHEWNITGLAQGKTYRYRVRSSDNLRNVAVAPAQPATFTVASPGPSGFEPAPTGLQAYTEPLFPGYVMVALPATTAAGTLKWNPVQSPVGATKYRVTVSVFGTTAYGPVEVTTNQTTFTISNVPTWPTMYTYSWSVVAIDSGSGAQSAPATSSFLGYAYEDW